MLSLEDLVVIPPGNIHHSHPLIFLMITFLLKSRSYSNNQDIVLADFVQESLFLTNLPAMPPPE